ncbi:MAG: preprotein translocase subunit SecE [Acidimicrobiia bacterium]|nr:preprotein translocase subunit SecE [Acidimicrobiia bacterium]
MRHIRNIRDDRDLRYGIEQRKGRFNLYKLDFELQKSETLKETRSLSEAIREASKHSKKSGAGAIVYQMDSSGEWLLNVYLPKKSRKRQILLIEGELLSDRSAVFLLLVLVGSWFLIAARPNSLSSTVPIITVPVALLIAGSLSVISAIAVDHNVTWPFREQLLKNTIALIATSVIAIAFVFSFELLSVPECGISGEGGTDGSSCDRGYQYDTAIFATIGSLMVTSVVLSMLQLIRLALEVYFYAKVSRFERQPGGPA